MKITIEDGFVELYDGETLVRVNYTENKATIGCNGNYLHITADQFNGLSKIMATTIAYAFISGAENGE